jgi:hypothetical protein
VIFSIYYLKLLHTLEGMLSSLKEFVFSNNILIDEQFNFRPRHSCINQVHHITEHILFGFTGTSLPKGTGTLFFDVAKAFNKVWLSRWSSWHRTKPAWCDMARSPNMFLFIRQTCALVLGTLIITMIFNFLRL